MKLITEHVDDVNFITEESTKKVCAIEGVFLQSNIKNRNGRVYPNEMMKNEVDRYVREYVSEGRAFGELGHPEGPQINLDRVAIIIENLTPDGANFIGRAKIVDTTLGNIARNIIEAGGRLGVSSRGVGSIRKNSKGIMEVQNDFRLSTAADIVADPSAPDAFVNGIMEGVEWAYAPDGSVHKTRAAETAYQEIEESVSKREFDSQKATAIFEKYLKSLM